MKPLISVIVPIYNVEKYLDTCISSIVNQTYKNLEIILVDDGSPDNCPQMCDSWAERDARIKVIHIKNGGAGNARNTGLRESSGEWISYIDSDDYIDYHMFEYLLSLTDDICDLSECQIAIVDKVTTEVFTDVAKAETDIIREDAPAALQRHIADKIFRQTPPNKIYRRKVVENIQFPVGKLIDDEFWTYRVIGNCRELVHSSAVLYAYRQQASSAMHKKFSLSRLQALEAKAERVEYVKNRFPSVTPEARASLWLSAMYLGQMSIKHLNGDEQKEAFQMINDTLSKHPLQLSDYDKKNIKARFWFGWERISIKNACYLRNLLQIGL